MQLHFKLLTPEILAIEFQVSASKLSYSDLEDRANVIKPAWESSR